MSIDDHQIPNSWRAISVIGLLYTILGLVTYYFEPTDREITHLPAWLRRIVDGIFVTLISLFAMRNSDKRPWRGWFQHPKFLWYALASVVVHYGGMLPPFYIYDYLPLFNKFMHVNASLVVVLFLTYAHEKKRPDKYDYLGALTIGVFWEILEYLTTPSNIDYWTVNDIGYGWHDTIGDLIANCIGILLIYMYFSFSNKGSANPVLSQ